MSEEAARISVGRQGPIVLVCAEADGQQVMVGMNADTAEAVGNHLVEMAKMVRGLAAPVEEAKP
jgi:hypothetical protein